MLEGGELKTQRSCLKKITVDVVQRLSESTHKRIDIIRRNGVIEVR
jgi:hypothetical protein